MHIQVGNNLKIFVTTNLNLDGKVASSGFTSSNTKEIFIVKDSLTAEQEKQHQYVDKYGLLDSQDKLEAMSKADLNIGTLNFSTTFNSSDSGPFDAWLWNSLTNDANYPSRVWEIADSSIKMDLVRKTDTTKQVGIVVFTDNTIYAFDAVRVTSIGLDFNIGSLLLNNWSMTFETYRLLEGELSLVGELYELSGALTGYVSKNAIEKYVWANSKTLKVYIDKQFEETFTGALAPISLSLSVSNNQTYIEDNSIDRTKLSQTYVDAGAVSITGSMGTYSRAPGSYSHTLIKEIDSYRDSPGYYNTYNIKLELNSTDSIKICEIQLNSCNLQSSYKFSTILSNNLNFKVVDGIEAEGCFIKFYT